MGRGVVRVLTLTLGVTEQFPAWSNGRSNLEALTGKTCGLANDVLVEQDPNAGLLNPFEVPAGEALGAVTAEGFGPNGIPSDVSADPVMENPGTTNFADTETGAVSANEAGTEGGTTAGAGVNGSRARLPFSLDPARTPVMGSWRGGTQQPAELRSAWYQLPPRDERGPLLVVSAAGRFDPGEVVVQWANDEQAAKGEPAGGVGFADVGSAPAWRNLRAPMAAIPRDATRIRLVATDDDLTRSTGSPSHPRASRSCAPCRTSSARRTRCCWTGSSAWRSRASARSAISTASSRCRSGASCPTASGRKRTRR